MDEHRQSSSILQLFAVHFSAALSDVGRDPTQTQQKAMNSATFIIMFFTDSTTNDRFFIMLYTR
jgi:hypothetical protein